MKKIVLLYIVIFSFSDIACSQNTITGTFTNLANGQVKLVGFEGFNTYVIDSVRVSEKGIFSLSFDAEDYGIGYLAAEDNKPFIVILAPNEDLKLEGEALAFPETVVITSGKQNHLFEKYASEHPRREQALSAWDFLEKIYRLDPLFTIHEKSKKTIEEEKKRIKEEDMAFLQSIDPASYAGWFLPLRRLVSLVHTIAQYRTEEIPAFIQEFRNLDYTDHRLYKSGLLRETIDAHFWLIENSGQSLDSVFMEMNKSIDLIIDNTAVDVKKFNEINKYLFNLLESRSLYGSSEYLALKVLSEFNHIVNSDLAERLEHWRVMKIGNTASDFNFEGELFAPGYSDSEIPQKVTDIEREFIVLFFGAAQCQSCHDELLQISGLYEKWKSYGVEVVFISLDDDKHVFYNFAGRFPFISMCDLKKWESPAVKGYHVFAMPTIYLLNTDLRILLRPGSARHMDAWVDWYLVQGNK